MFQILKQTTIIYKISVKSFRVADNVGALRGGQKQKIMKVQFGKWNTKYGTGVQIDLTGSEVATAIYSYLMAHNVVIDGAATITVNGELCQEGGIYVDPSGRVIADGEGWNGRGHKE